MAKLDRWAARQPLSAAHLNQPVDVLRKITGTDDWDTSRLGANGEPEYMAGWRLARIRGTGPSGETDFTDERYWIIDVEIVRASGGYGDRLTTRDRADYDPGDGGALAKPIYPATNVAERLMGTHALKTGTLVLYRIEYDDPSWTTGQEALNESPDPPNPRYVFNGPQIVGLPQYPGMVLQGAPMNETAWDYLPAVEDL
jgi:hypothetical protein